MKRSFIATFSLMAAALLMAACLFSGCVGNSASNVNSEQQANRAYMSQVNEIMDQVSVELEEFVNAVSAGDVVGMRAQAEDASRALAKISSLEPPEALKDIQQSYVDGVAKLQDALNQYVTLYAETDSASFNSANFEERLASIQSLYDEGVAALKKGDEDAAGL